MRTIGWCWVALLIGGNLTQADTISESDRIIITAPLVEIAPIPESLRGLSFTGVFANNPALLNGVQFLTEANPLIASELLDLSVQRILLM